MQAVDRTRIRLAVLVAVLLSALMADTSSSAYERHAVTARLRAFAQRLDVREFQRGNVHAHTTASDGHATGEEVARWYRDHGYQFLAITDHDAWLDPATLSRMESRGFVILGGEEITSLGEKAPIHVNALCTSRRIGGAEHARRHQAVQAAVDAIAAQGGIALVNHPNYGWGLSAEDLLRVRGRFLLEIASGHPAVNAAGDERHASHAQIWESLLRRGRSISGVAVDDMHELEASADGEGALPGRGWIETFGGETSRGAICAALAAGRFYASTGARFDRIAVEERAVTVWPSDEDAVVEFVDADAKVLGMARAARGDGVVYRLRGDERLVRVHVKSARGEAWTQPFETRG